MALALLLACILPATALGCSEDEADDGTKPQAVDDLPALELTDDTSDLLLTWIDDRGNTHTEVAIADVPEKSREMVRVIVTDKQEGQGAALYVADLSRKKADGRYPVRVMTRSKWESVIEKRRDAYAAKHAPPPPPKQSASAGPAPPTGGGIVAIVYGAEWCGPCHQAAAHLKKRGVKVVEKNIEKDRKAQTELQRKLKRAGKGGASIPVIDIDGQILVGYSSRALDRAIKKARGTIQL